MEIVLIVLILLASALIYTITFYFLLNRAAPFKEVFKLTCIAAALNKFIFTGSGYLASSYFSRRKNLQFHKVLAAFFILEFFSVIFWLVLGIYFGAKIAFRAPLVLYIVLIIFAVTLFFKKNKVISFGKNIVTYFKQEGKSVFIALPFIFLNMVLGVVYYFFLFKFFHFSLDFLSIIKIIAVSFTAGYLSPAPSGLGFKDAGLVFLLTEKGFILSRALSFAFWDRILVTAIWGILGITTGADVIKDEIKKRFFCKK